MRDTVTAVMQLSNRLPGFPNLDNFGLTIELEGTVSPDLSCAMPSTPDSGGHLFLQREMRGMERIQSSCQLAVLYQLCPKICRSG